MVIHTNVNDPEFLNDYCRLNDLRRDINSQETALRDVMIDMYGEPAYIFDGLWVQNGGVADSFLVHAGRARDNNKYHILVPAFVNNIPSLDATGADNYIAIKHTWAYTNPDAAVKTGLAYFRTRSDHYEINVALVPHAEKDGWVRLARATKPGGVAWEYDMEYSAANPNYARSRQAELESWTEDFTYLGAPPAPVFMDRHSLIGLDMWRVPYDVVICKVSVIVAMPGANPMNVDLFLNGAAHIAWPVGTLTLPPAMTEATWYNPSGFNPAGGAPVQYHKDNLLQVQLTPGAGAPTDIVVDISGRKTANV